MAATLIAGLLLPTQARAQGHSDISPPPPNYPAKAFDAVILRPLGLAAAVVGVALFVPAAILTAPGGRDSIEEAWDLFVLTPGKYVFERPLGDF